MFRRQISLHVASMILRVTRFPAGATLVTQPHTTALVRSPVQVNLICARLSAIVVNIFSVFFSPSVPLSVYPPSPTPVSLFFCLYVPHSHPHPSFPSLTFSPTLISRCRFFFSLCVPCSVCVCVCASLSLSLSLFTISDNLRRWSHCAGAYFDIAGLIACCLCQSLPLLQSCVYQQLWPRKSCFSKLLSSWPASKIEKNKMKI